MSDNKVEEWVSDKLARYGCMSALVGSYVYISDGYECKLESNEHVALRESQSNNRLRRSLMLWIDL